ncbi:MAG: ABC-F family ATP-binding cassette domain-containing protein, partial [Mesorhizobium sp.]
MALISLKSVGVTMSAPLFSNLDLTIGAGDRLGIVAANGRGKSTLLKCLAGEFEPTSGDITRSRGLRVGHVEQSVPGALLNRSFHDVVADALPVEQRDSELWRVDVVLDSLDVPEDMRGRPMRALSGGWQRLALIARVWVTDPDVLLLDEPTNHLDLAR